MDKNKLKLTEVRSLVDLSEAQLDEEDYTVKGARIIKSGLSLNGNYYSESVIEAATPLFEGINAYANHPDPKDRGKPRDVEKTVGYFDNTRYREGGSYGDFRVLGEARRWLWPLIQETIKTGHEIVALSINAQGEGYKGKVEGKPANIVEAITYAHSVDTVAAASAGGGFTHLLQSDDGWLRATLEKVSMDELAEARPDLVEDFKRQWKTVRDSQAIKEAQDQAAEQAARADSLTEENQTLKAQLDEARKEKAALQKAALVDRLLEGKTKLPNEWKQVIRTELLESEPDSWESILAREVQKFQAVKPKVTVTGAGRMAPSAPAALPQSTAPIHEALGSELPDDIPWGAPSEVVIKHLRERQK